MSNADRTQKSEPVNLSIVIVSYNTREMLRKCMQSLPASLPHHSWDVWVVDNDSSDGSAEMIACDYPAAHLISNRHNPGFACANNQALKECSGRILLLLNPDTEPHPGSLSLMIDYLEKHDDVGVVGPMLLNTDGSLQHNGGRFPSPIRDLLTYTGLIQRLPDSTKMRIRYGSNDFNAVRNVDQVSGACLMFPRSVFDKIGGLDESYFMFFEEIEFCLRVQRTGKRVVYYPEAKVVHHWMGSVRKNYREMEKQLNRSRILYYRKTAGIVTIAFGILAAGIAHLHAEFISTGVKVKRKLKGLMKPGEVSDK